MRKKNFLEIDAKIYYDSKTDKFSRFILPHPFSVCYKVNEKCNYNCSHCLVGGSISSDEGLSTVKAKKIIDEIKKSGTIRLDITGGEPYIRRDIDELLEYAVKVGLEVVITTNGSLLTEKNIELLSKYNIFTQISIDGPQEVNDRLRGKNSFNVAVNAIKKLLNKNVPIRINCTLQNKNKNVIPEVVNIAKSLGVKNLYFILACLQGRAKNNKVCLSEKYETDIKNEILGYRLNKDINVKMLDFKKYSYGCVLIDSNGDFISQCWDEILCRISGNILKDDMQKMWRESNDFDHALHLIQYLRHPMLYN